MLRLHLHADPDPACVRHGFGNLAAVASGSQRHTGREPPERGARPRTDSGDAESYGAVPRVRRRPPPAQELVPSADTSHVNSDRRPMPGRRRSSDEVKWIDRWLAACSDLDELKRSNPMTDAVIDEIDGRRIRVGEPVAGRLRLVQLPRLRPRPRDHGLDPARTSRSGARTRAGRACWAARCSSAQIEERLTELLGCEDSLVLPTITHIHMSVIPVLAGRRHDLHRQPRPQDDLRRLPVRRRRAARRSSASGSRTPTTSSGCCAEDALRAAARSAWTASTA